MNVSVVSLEDVVSEKVRPGRTIYLGNFGSQLFSVGHEIIRQRIHDLDVVIASGGVLLDQLFGAGVVRSATFGHCWIPVGPSPAWNFRRVAESGDRSVRLHEMSLGMLTAALTAGAWDVPFMPVPGLMGTGFVDEDWSGGQLGLARSEFGDCHVVTALAPDVAFVHVDKCDTAGNGWIPGPLGEVAVASAAARETVLITEELVDEDNLRGTGITIPGVSTTTVVVYPGAVAPDGALGRYDRDIQAYERYVAATATREGFEEWVRGLDQPRTPDATA